MSFDPVVLDAGLDRALRDLVVEIPDFPIPGIRFKDISPLLAIPRTLTCAIDALHAAIDGWPIDAVLAVDARGFVVGAPLADRLGAGFVMVRKPGKLPGDRHSFDYTCEYSTGRLEVTRGAVPPGTRCLIVDDVLATGGTARATADFVRGLDADVAGFCFLVEITALNGRARLHDGEVVSLLRY